MHVVENASVFCEKCAGGNSPLGGVPQKTKNAVFSIHLESLRVDIWTMTSGGITTREIIPSGFCDEVEIIDVLNYIHNKKLNNTKD